MLLPFVAQAQQMPERGKVRRGNRQYAKGNYDESIARYKEAVAAAPGMFEPIFNLGNALYKAERYDHAEKTMAQAAADSTRTAVERAEAYYNLGNAQFKQQKLQEALQSYKQSLMLNPADREAKYNYAYTKRLIDDQKQQQQQQDQNKDQQNQNQNQDQQNQDQQKQDQNGQPQDQKGKPEEQKSKPEEQKGDPKDEPGEKKDGKNDPTQGEGQPVEQGISKDEQEQMLDAIQAQENRTKDRLKDKKKKKGVIRLKKNW